MDDIYLVIIAQAFIDLLILIYATTAIKSLKERLNVLERNFGESTLGCYNNDEKVQVGEFDESIHPGRMPWN